MRFFGKKKEKDPYENLDFRAEMQLLQDEKDKAAKLANETVDGVQNEVKAKMGEGQQQASELLNKIQAQGSNIAGNIPSIPDMAGMSNTESKIPDMDDMSNMASSISGMADNVPSMDDMSKNFPDDLTKGLPDGLSSMTDMLGINGNSDGSNENPLPSFEMNEEEKKIIEESINKEKEDMKKKFEDGLNKYFKQEDNKEYLKEETHKFIDTHFSEIIKKDEKDEIKKALINVIKNNLENPIFKNKEEKKKEEPPPIEIVIGDPTKVPKELLQKNIT